MLRTAAVPRWVTKISNYRKLRGLPSQAALFFLHRSLVCLTNTCLRVTKVDRRRPKAFGYNTNWFRNPLLFLVRISDNINRRSQTALVAYRVKLIPPLKNVDARRNSIFRSKKTFGPVLFRLGGSAAVSNGFNSTGLEHLYSFVEG